MFEWVRKFLHITREISFSISRFLSELQFLHSVIYPLYSPLTVQFLKKFLNLGHFSKWLKKPKFSMFQRLVFQVRSRTIFEE
ncbi:MAG: hypothetical protein C4288_02850 [Leptolyngbya sp. ERB_1_1]